MKLHVRAVVAALAAALAIGGAVAHAQTPAFRTAQTAEFDTSFAFQVAGKTMPAGKYSITVNGNGPIVVRGPGGDVSIPVMTRLGRLEADSDPEFVFDRVGDTVLLSEVWMPGQDGFLLTGTKEIHSHSFLRGKGGKK